MLSRAKTVRMHEQLSLSYASAIVTTLLQGHLPAHADVFTSKAQERNFSIFAASDATLSSHAGNRTHFFDRVDVFSKF